MTKPEAIPSPAQRPPINTRAAWHPWLRPVARVVIGAHLALVLQPLSALAQAPGASADHPVAQAQLQRLFQWQQKLNLAQATKAQASLAPGHASATSSAASDRTARNLSRAQELVRSLRRASAAKPRPSPTPRDTALAPARTSVDAETQALSSALDAIDADTDAALAEFHQLRQGLIQQGVSNDILLRHDQTEAELQTRANTLRSLIQAWRTGPSSAKLAAISDYFDRYPAGKKPLALDPQKLPWSTPKPNTRAPATTQTAWFQNLYGKQSVRLAQAGASVGPLQFNIPPAPGEAPTAADLAPTPEVQLTAAIQAQAQALGNNPVNIHNWVRNQVEWVPTWGSIQGAQDTLDKKRGNAFDIASLEIALLRAAHIPARYQLGTVEIPAAQAMNWVGGVQKPEAAVVLLNQGGIAATGLSNGGSIQAIRMEHVWVQAYVNWAPGRGSQNASANQHVNPNGPLNAWVPLDASYKQYNYTLGIGLKSVAPALGQSLSQSALQGASVTTNYAQNFNTAALLTQIANYKTQVKAYIDASTSGPGSTVDDVLGKKNIAARTHSLLGDGQSYLTVMTGVQAAEIPDNLRWKLAINLYQSDSDVANQSPSVSVSLALPQLTTKRLAISYEPASPSDQSVIDAAAQSGQLKFAAYLVRFVPKIKLDFAVLGAGYAQTPGIAGQLFVVLNGPSGSIDRSYQLTSGDTSVLSVSSSGVTAQGYFNRSENFAMSALDSSKYGMQGLTEEMLHQLGLAWWAQKFVGQDNMAALTDVVQYQLPSHALIMAPISASYFFGMVRSASYKTRAIDAKLDYISAQHKNGDLVPRREFLRAAGKYGSYLEGAVFDQAFSPFSQGGISTIGLLAEASREGLRIFKINAENANLIGQLSVDSSVQDEISAALSNGLEATISESNVSLGGYTGVGYIIENPSDGSAAYQIEGGRSGGQAQASENVVPIPAMPDNQLIGILLSSGLRTSGAKLGVDNGGMIVGLILPSVVIDGPALTALLGVLCLMIMLSQSLGAILDSIYPRDTGAGTRWRKYTKYQDFIVARLLLYASNYGTFGGDGVYVADAAAEERRGVTCSTMSPLDVATRFQIPNPEKPDPINVTGYVDIIELRKGYLTVQKFGPNSAGQLEYKITRPIIFVPELRPMPGAPSIATALVLVPGAVEIDDVCKLN